MDGHRLSFSFWFGLLPEYGRAERPSEPCLPDMNLLFREYHRTGHRGQYAELGACPHPCKNL